ncbi:hypothetical protein D3C76_63460 [compost metagenome]
MEQLLIRLTPEHDESIHSFISRTAAANFMMSVQELYKLADLKGKRYPVSLYQLDEDKFDKLSEITNFPKDKYISLRSLSECGDVEEKVQFKYAIHTSKIKVCPECLNTKGYLRKTWDIALVTVCPIHQLLLIDTCSSCHRQLSVHRKKSLLCTCGYVLCKDECNF